jgi:hypothetical protein
MYDDILHGIVGRNLDITVIYPSNSAAPKLARCERVDVRVLTQSLHTSMKTKTGSSRLALLAIAITAASVTQPVLGVSDHQILITEKSSTSLTATFDGLPFAATPVSSDNWFFLLPAGFLSFGQPAWTEPENSSLVNWVDFSLNRAAYVHSDISPFSFFTSTNRNDKSVQVGTYQGGNVFATFNDLGDTAAVPDTGTTGSLFGFAMVGLALFRRKLG